jgi:serine/threonine protein kinase
MHYSDQQLTKFLEGVDSDEIDHDLAKTDLGHLESCEKCRERLSKLAGEGPWLNDWMDSVGDETSQFESTDISNRSSSVLISVEPSDAMHEQLQCDSVRLDFLESPAHPELLGRLGRYDIERLVGTGGFGVVFKARDSELNRIVAIKVLAPHLMNSGPARQRFAREAQASAAVVHDHVVPIYDVVVNETICYFVMQYIAGESLQERVDRRGPLSTEDVLRIGAQMAAGLHAAHEQGLIHRDVKPGNVLLEDTVNRVMISDFGLARAADDASITRSGAITGTPHYMSPEQAKGGAIDLRSDLFSLGSVIYFMCTGRSPFRAPQMMAVLNRVCHEDYRPVEEINPNVPYELTQLVDRLLNKDPRQRFESADEVHILLQRLLNDFQSGNLRPRRFLSPRLLAKKHRGAIAVAMGTAIGLLAWLSAPTLMSQRQTGEEVASTTTSIPGDTNGRFSLTTNPPPSGQRRYTQRGLSIAGSFVGDAIQEALVATQNDINDIECRAACNDSLSQDSLWSHEVGSINALLTTWEQELDSEMNACDHGLPTGTPCPICNEGGEGADECNEPCCEECDAAESEIEVSVESTTTHTTTKTTQRQ